MLVASMEPLTTHLDPSQSSWLGPLQLLDQTSLVPSLAIALLGRDPQAKAGGCIHTFDHHAQTGLSFGDPSQDTTGSTCIGSMTKSVKPAKFAGGVGGGLSQGKDFFLV